MNALRRMVDTAERAAQADPAFRPQLAAHLNRLGWRWPARALPATLWSCISGRCAMVEQLVRQEPQSDELRLLLSYILGNIGGLQAGQGRSSEALASFTKAIAASKAVVAASKAVVAASPSVSQSRVSMDSLYHKLGMLLGDLGRYEEAGEAFHKARDVREVLARDFPEDPDFQDQLAEIDHNIGVLHFSLGHGTEAFQAYAHARECWERLAAAHPEQIDIATRLGGVYCQLGTVEAETLGHPQAGVEWCNRAVEKLAAVLKRVPANAEARKFLAHSYRTRALALLALGRHAEGRADLDRALEIAPITQKDELRFTRAMFLVMVGEYAAAVSEARAIANAARLPAGPAAYDLACVYAVASATAAADRRLPQREALRIAPTTWRLGRLRSYGERTPQVSSMIDPIWTISTTTAPCFLCDRGQIIRLCGSTWRFPSTRLRRGDDQGSGEGRLRAAEKSTTRRERSDSIRRRSAAA